MSNIVPQSASEMLNVECEVLNPIHIPHSPLNIESAPPLTSCAARSIETRPSTSLGTGKSEIENPNGSADGGGQSAGIDQSALDTRHSTLDTTASFENRKSKIENPSLLIRPATLADVAFIDRLQKKQSKQVGWFSTKTIEGKIGLGHVLVACISTERKVLSTEGDASPSLSTQYSSPSTPAPAGYLIGNDQYHKRDELGCIFQINVAPEFRRHLVAARLLQAQFDRSAYGCRLYCCWCAQDIEANRFWESMGFVPLAFRAGSRKRDRVHIFWQKRIRAGDDGDPSRGGTPWWFPSLTGGGSLREDRIVLPIPPGVRWNDEMPRVLPQSEERRELREERALPDQRQVIRDEGQVTAAAANRKSDLSSRNSLLSSSTGRLRFFGAKAKKPKKAKPSRKVIKFTPEQMATSRELRDRWQEQVNAGRGDELVALPAPKYQIARGEAIAPLDGVRELDASPTLLIAAA